MQKSIVLRYHIHPPSFASGIKWQTQMIMVFIDFLKAFDSIHHGIMWKILLDYGTQLNIPNITKTLNQDFMFYADRELFISAVGCKIQPAAGLYCVSATICNSSFAVNASSNFRYTQKCLEETFSFSRS